MNYVPGDFYRICDRCGFKMRASQTFRTWDNLYVCVEDFETRHPQDFVRGRKDRQVAPNARPEPLDTLIGPLHTTLTAAASAGAILLNVESSTRFLTADVIGIMLANGDAERRVVFTAPSATSIQVTVPLTGPALAGAVITNFSAVSEADIG